MYCAPQYKFYGPHIGVLYGKYDLLDRLQSVPQGAACAQGPVGQGRDRHALLRSHEGIAGTLAAVNYLAQIGELYGEDYAVRFPGFSGRRLHLKRGMTVLREYDYTLSAAILEELETRPACDSRDHGSEPAGEARADSVVHLGGSTPK